MLKSGWNEIKIVVILIFNSDFKVAGSYYASLPTAAFYKDSVYAAFASFLSIDYE